MWRIAYFTFSTISSILERPAFGGTTLCRMQNLKLPTSDLPYIECLRFCGGSSPLSIRSETIWRR